MLGEGRWFWGVGVGFVTLGIYWMFTRKRINKSITNGPVSISTKPEKVLPPEVNNEKATHFRDFASILKNGDTVSKCNVLNDVILQLSFHADGQKFILQNDELLLYLMDSFTFQLLDPNTDKETEARLCGWIVANTTLYHEARLKLPFKNNSNSRTIISCIEEFLRGIAAQDSLHCVMIYDLKSKILSLFLSVLQILLNISSCGNYCFFIFFVNMF